MKRPWEWRVYWAMGWLTGAAFAWAMSRGWRIAAAVIVLAGLLNVPQWIAHRITRSAVATPGR